MPRMGFSQAIDDALAAAMAQDDRIVVFGEDVHTIRRSLLVRFGAERVRAAPISESAFVGAAVAAAMAGLRPVVEVMLVDFIGTAMDALLNHAAKVEAFSGGRWSAPMVVRSACGGGYGDGGQHEQSLWGWLAHIPGLAVVVPSTPADAGGLMASALRHPGPVVFLEHKLLSETWLEFLGRGGRRTVRFDVPAGGARGRVPGRWTPIPIGKAGVVRGGADISLVSVAVGVHRCLEAADALRAKGVAAEVIDIRTVSPLDGQTIRQSADRTGRVVVVDEDYEGFGLSGEIAAVLLAAGFRGSYARVCTTGTIPYSRALEEAALPSAQKIVEAAERLVRSTAAQRT